MPARRNKTNKSARTRSVLGRLMSPVNVTNNSNIASAMKSIRNAPVTIVLIYANWCGHCHTYMPFFDKMSRASNRTANTVKIEESSLKNFNSALVKNFPEAKPLDADGYPTLLAVSKKGEVMSQLPVVRENEPNAKMIRSVGNIAASIPAPATVANKAIATPNVPAAKIRSTPLALTNTGEVNMADTAIEVVTPPSAESDISPAVGNMNVALEASSTETIPEPPPRLVGGTGLYGALLDATYQLAPAAVLTGVATGLPKLMRKTRKGKTKRSRVRA